MFFTAGLCPGRFPPRGSAPTALPRGVLPCGDPPLPLCPADPPTFGQCGPYMVQENGKPGRPDRRPISRDLRGILRYRGGSRIMYSGTSAAGRVFLYEIATNSPQFGQSDPCLGRGGESGHPDRRPIAHDIRGILGNLGGPRVSFPRWGGLFGCNFSEIRPNPLLGQEYGGPAIPIGGRSHRIFAGP